MSARAIARVRDGLVSAASMGIVGTTLVAFNQDLRTHVTELVGGDAYASLAVGRAQVASVSHAVQGMVGQTVADHMPLVVFGAAGLVLFAFMFRS